MRTTSLITVAALFLGACNYEPPLRGKDDRWRRDDHANTLRGSVQLVGPSADIFKFGDAIEDPDDPRADLDCPSVRGMVLVFDAFNPGPPEGTSGPVDFAVIDGCQWVGNEDFGWTADWAATDVPDGEYVFDVIIDTDGDFQPLMFTLAGATCGDWQGSHFGINQPATTTTVTTTADTGDTGMAGSPAVYGKGRIRVGYDAEGENDPVGQVVSGIDILAEQELTTERPAFAVVGEGGYTEISLNDVGTSTLPPEFTLRSIGVHVSFLEDDEVLEPSLEMADPCPSENGRECLPTSPECAGAFSLYYPDSDGDGKIDFHPDYPTDLGLKDVWPRVFLAYKGTPVIEDGKPAHDPETGYPLYETLQDSDADGYSYGTEAFTFGVLAAGFNAPVIASAVGAPVNVNNIDVMFPPLVAKFYDEWNDECGELPEGTDPADGCTVLFDLADDADRAKVPRGIWEINVVGWNGQTWGIPNEISEMGLPASPDHDDYDITSQGGFLYVVD